MDGCRAPVTSRSFHQFHLQSYSSAQFRQRAIWTKEEEKRALVAFFLVPLLQQEGSCCDPSSACQTCFSLSFLLESFHNDIRPSSRVRQRRRAGKCFVEGGPRLSLSGWPHLYAAIRRVV